MKKPRKPKPRKAPKAAAGPFREEQIRNVEVTADDMKTAMAAVAELPEEDRSDWEAFNIAVMKAFGFLTGEKQERDEEYFKRMNKMVAVQMRLEAMFALVDKERFKAWTMKADEPGAIFFNEYFLRATAVSPILGGEKGEICHFDEENFARLMLEISEVEGKA
jgi:hypothetical protein